MRDIDYIKATNMAKVSMALNILRDVLSGDEEGVNSAQISKIRVQLTELQAKLFSSVRIR